MLERMAGSAERSFHSHLACTWRAPKLSLAALAIGIGELKKRPRSRDLPSLCVRPRICCRKVVGAVTFAGSEIR